MKQNLTIDGQLEIDYNRGVIYFHARETGHTMLRACQLSRLKECPDGEELLYIDITHMYGTEVTFRKESKQCTEDSEQAASNME